MGAEPYDYTVPYDEDVAGALDRLREEVFASGEFRGAELDPASPEEAMAMMAEEGTASILDILELSDEPDFCAAAPFSPEELRRYFGTLEPTESDLARADFGEDIERGQCRYLILYENGQPAKLHFAGYSFD